MDNWKVSEAWVTSIVLMFIPLGMMLRILYLRKQLKWLLCVPAVGILWVGNIIFNEPTARNFMGIIGGIIWAPVIFYYLIYPFTPPFVIATTTFGSAFFLMRSIRDRDVSAIMNLIVCLVSLALMTYVCISLGRLTIPVSFNL